MEYVEVQGARVPALGLGTWLMTGRECENAVRTALDLGYRHLDTAQIYGNEVDVGRAIEAARVPREELWLTTKIDRARLRRDDVLRTTRESLARLRTDHVDLLLIHWPNPDVPLEETLDAMSQLKAEGAARHLGVSNFPPSLLKRALSITPLFCNQVEYHPFLDQRRLHALSAEHDLLLTAYSPLARGEVMSSKVLQQIGKRHGKTPAQVALRWLLQQERVAAIPKALKHEHLVSNLDIFDFELGHDEMRQIGQLQGNRRLISPEFAPHWG